MISFRIDGMNVFGGTTYFDVMQLAEHSQLGTNITLWELIDGGF